MANSDIKGKYYEKYMRPYIRTGDIVGVKGRGFISEGIKIVTSKDNGNLDDYSHVGLAAWVYGHLFIIEAIGEGVVLRGFSDSMAESPDAEFSIFRRKESLTEDDEYNLVHQALTYRSRPYGRKQILKILLGVLLNNDGVPISGDDLSLICTEVTERSFYFGISDKLVPEALYDGISPNRQLTSNLIEYTGITGTWTTTLL